jgi:regulation of enolase protein 1 (concanavalin A-like superfamily)
MQTLGHYARLKNGIHYKDGVHTFTVQVCTDEVSDDGTTTQKVIEEQDVEHPYGPGPVTG